MASVKLDGTVLVEGEAVGILSGFSFSPTLGETDESARILSILSATQSLPDEVERRLKALQASEDMAFQLDSKGQVFWREAQIARLVKSDNLYAPLVEIGDSDLLSDAQKTRLSDRLSGFVAGHVTALLSVLTGFQDLPESDAPESDVPAPDVPESDVPESDVPESEEAKPDESPDSPTSDSPTSDSPTSDSPTPDTPAPDTPAPKETTPLSTHGRAILHQLYDGLGAVNRASVALQLRELLETDKPYLARSGVRIGIETIYMPDMLKPALIKLRVLLYSLYHDDFPECGPPDDGRVSIDLVPDVADTYWLAAGYRRIGDKVMRVDMVERVAALVRAAARGGRFKMRDEMLSLAGVSRQTMALMLADLGCKQVDEEPSEDPEKPATPIFEREVKKRPSGYKQAGNKPAGNKKPYRKPDQGGDTTKKSHTKKPQPHKSGGDRGRPNADKRIPEKLPDPNSPFAVLAALKKKLDG